jgi:ABC-type sugar transport system ATPase subunit
MTVTRNIFLGRELPAANVLGRILGLCDDRAMGEQARGALDRLGARIPDLSAPVSALSGGQRQAVAIARAFLWGHRLVILDEPAAALGVEQSKHVLEMILNLKRQGVTVLLISHNIQHVWEVADRVTVLRLGRTVGVRTVTASSHEEIVGLITGAGAPGGAPGN